MIASQGAKSPTIVLVLGMHRSGTSALAGAMSRLGFGLGLRLVPAAADNPLGYFENAAAVEINEALLLDLGRGWDDLRALPADWLDSDAANRARDRIDAWIDAEVLGSPRFLLKDPRLCLLLPLWLERITRRGLDVRAVLAHRALAEVQASVAARDGMSARHALLLSLRHALLAERDSRGLPRVIVTYDRLLTAPSTTLSTALRALGFAPPSDDRLEAAAAGLRDAARHHRDAGAPVDAGDLGALCAALEIAAVEDADAAMPRPHAEGLLATVEACCVAEAPRLQPRADALLAARRRAAAADVRVLVEAQARAGTETLARDRLHQAEALDQRVRQVDTALAACEAEIARLRDAASALDTAKSAAEALALQRLEELRTLDAALGDTQQALARVTALAEARQAGIDALSAQLAEAGTLAATLERQLEAFRATRVWRLVQAIDRARRQLFGGAS